MSSRIMHRPIQLRHSDDEGIDDAAAYSSDENEVGSEDDDASGASDTSDVTGEDDPDDEDGRDSQLESESETEDGTEISPEVDVGQISFGALAKAQESFVPPSRSKKRKRPELGEGAEAELEAEKTRRNGKEHEDYSPAWKQTQARKEGGKHRDSRPNQPIHRSSKHAPTVLSSKHPVSRKRQVLEPSAATTKFRDPRFDAAITSTTLNSRAIAQADKNYAFLTDYQASEILHLKAQLNNNNKKNSKKKSKNQSTAAAAAAAGGVVDEQKDEEEEKRLGLKKEIMSLEAKLRNSQTREKQREILSTHKQQEKKAIREGKKQRPFYLNRSSLRKKIRQDEIDAMGKKQRDKMEGRKLKRLKTKDAKGMPRFRRGGRD